MSVYVEPLARAVWHAHETDDDFNDERIARLGGRWADICLHQSFSLWGTLSAANELLALAGYSAALHVRIAGVTLPFFLWACQSRTKKNPDGWANRTIYTVHNNIGKFCYAISIGSTVALLAFGNKLKRLQGGLSLGLIGLGYCDKRFNPKARYYGRLGAQAAAIGAAIFYGDRYESLLALASAANFLYAFVPEGDSSQEARSNVVLNEESLKKYELDKLIVDWGHIRAYQPLLVPEVPHGVKISDLRDLFAEIDWTAEPFASQLAAQEIGDEDWQSSPQEGRDTEGAYRRWMKRGVDQFVEQLESEGGAGGNGDVKDWEGLKRKTKHIIARLQEMKRKDPEATAGYLTSIGLEIGNYCLPDYPEKVRSLYAEVCERPEGEQEILAKIFAEERLRIFDNLVYERYSSPTWWFAFMAPFLDRTDGHVQNILAWVFGRTLGLPNKAVAREDAHAAGHLGEKILCWLVWHDLVDQFWKKYTTERHLQLAKLAINNEGKKGVAIERDKINSWIMERWSGEDVGVCYSDSAIRDEVIGAYLWEQGFLSQPQTHS